MRRVITAGVWLLSTGLAFAQAAPGDDDEKPGARSAPPAPAAAKPAPEPSDTPPPQGEAPLKLSGQGAAQPEGSYAGVSLGGQGLPPKPPKLPLKGPQRMTWPGFQVRDGVPTVFLQTTGTPDYAVAERGGSLLVTLRGTKIALRNNQRPLKVAEFGTAVTEVSAKPHGHDVVVTIKRKEAGPHRERVEPSAGGYQLLVVELPGK